MKFRPQRGALAESLSETVEFINIDDMLEYIVSIHNGAFDKSDIIIEKDVIFDNRCNWNTQYVCVKRYYDEDYIKLYGCPQCIGMCDLGKGEKMDKVYGVFAGEYSDWECLGFFIDESEAEKYCMLQDDRYIMEIDNLSGETDLSKVKTKWRFDFGEDFKDYWRNVENGSLCNSPEFENGVVKSTSLKCKYRISVAIDERNKDKARKVAQDLFAKWKYENLVEEHE